MNLIFSAGSIDKCLQKAAEKLNIDKNNIDYKVIKEERHFFKKTITIEVYQEDNASIENNKHKKNTINDGQGIENYSYGARVHNGKIIVKSLGNGSITIKSCDGVDLILNGEKTDLIENANESDDIKYHIEEDSEPEKRMEIFVSKDKMEAYVTIISIPKKIYALEDCEFTKNLMLKKVVSEKQYAPKYTKEEIKNALKDRNVVFGFLEDNINELCRNENSEEVLVAKGVQAVQGIPEKIEVLFKDSDKIEESDGTEEKIDYRNRFMLATVQAGKEIANIIPAVPGKDGKDVYGNDVKCKDIQKVKFKIGEGCKYENNKIIAVVEGKPSFKSNIFKVYQVYQVEEVDLSTGNINFVSDVEVQKNVCEGMEIIAGNTVFVGKNVESAQIAASSNITVNGNILNSIIIAGENSINKNKYLMNLKEAKNTVGDLFSAVIQIKDNDIFNGKNIGEIVKILIENKYKSLILVCENILDECKNQGIKDSPITSFIREKIIGFGPLNISEAEELIEFEELLQEEIDEMEEFQSESADVYAEYIQGSKIESIGNVFINGKGQYTSEITAVKNIEFSKENSVCRGGILSAGKEIKLKTVGSEAGVNTILKVPKEGIITADVAYSNTVFCFGDKQMVLDVSSKNVKAYVDEMGDITIDKLRL